MKLNILHSILRTIITLPVFVVFRRPRRKMKRANALRMTQTGQLDAEVPTLPDRFGPR